MKLRQRYFFFGIMLNLLLYCLFVLCLNGFAFTLQPPWEVDNIIGNITDVNIMPFRWPNSDANITILPSCDSKKLYNNL